MKTIRLVLLPILLCACCLRAEDPKPPATADWALIFRDLQAADLVAKTAAAQAFTAALEVQAKTSTKPYFADFKKRLASDDAKIKEAALAEAGNIGLSYQNNKRHFPDLMKDLTGNDEKVKGFRLEAIFKSLELTLMSDRVRELIEQLGNDDAKVQAKAEEELRAMKGDAADELATGLDDDKVAVKKKCAELLRDMGPAAKDAVDTLLFKLRDTDDKLGRKLAIQALEQLGPDAAGGVDDLIQNLDDDDKILRKVSANILKKIGSAYKSGTSDLINYLTHDEKPVRAAAAELLLLLGADAKEGVKELIDVIEDTPAPATPPPANPPAVNPPVTPPPATPPPAPFVADADSKTHAVKILASIGPAAKDALPALKKLENSPDPALKEAVKDALEKINAAEKK